MNRNKRRHSFVIKESNGRRKKHKTCVELKNAPPVNSIKDLIEIGKTINFYKNLNTIMLWKITPYLEQLEEMIGMQSLKKTIFTQIIYYLKGFHLRGKKGEYLNTVIQGSPGTGKTTIAHIIGKLYKSMGVLSPTGTFRVAYRDDFVGEYVGHTAPKTRKLLDSCIGGVLFIDEVYSLGPGRKDKDSFSKEVFDIMTAFLSEHKKDFCCIIAGYEEEINNCFFKGNKGLRRRFSWTHDVDDYSSLDLAKIMFKMATEIEWSLNIKEEELADIIKENKEYFKNAGGDIETYLTKCKMSHAHRVFSLGNEHQFILTKDDFIGGMRLVTQNKKVEEIDISIQHMYT